MYINYIYHTEIMDKILRNIQLFCSYDYYLIPEYNIIEFYGCIVKIRTQTIYDNFRLRKGESIEKIEFHTDIDSEGRKICLMIIHYDDIDHILIINDIKSLEFLLK